MKDTDSNLVAIKDCWSKYVGGDSSCPFLAKQIYSNLRSSPGHPAFGWAALICGREATYREAVTESEDFLISAVGSFIYSGDHYGRALAEAHLALPAVFRLELDTALKFALSPWSSPVTFSDLDTLVLHAIVGYIYWQRDDIHSALLSNIQALVIADRLGNISRRIAILSNVSAALGDFAQHALAASVADEALRFSDALSIPTTTRLTCLCNAVTCNTAAGNLRKAEEVALALRTELNVSSPVAWTGYSALCRLSIAKKFAREARDDWIMQRLATERSSNQASEVRLLSTHAEVLELEGDFDRAISVALQVLDIPLRIVSRTGYREAGACLSRCYAALGRSAESTRWKRFAASHAHADHLSTVFAAQIEASLKRDLPNPLTPQEIECLQLSARGQTSADIGLKMGIKPRTVNFHMSKVLRKLNALNRQEAIAKAINANFLQM